MALVWQCLSAAGLAALLILAVLIWRTAHNPMGFLDPPKREPVQWPVDEEPGDLGWRPDLPGRE